MNIELELSRAKLALSTGIEDRAFLAQLDIRQQAANAREAINAMHSFAKRSIAQGRRWFLFNKINGGTTK